MAFNAKNLSYDAQEPAFLRRLRQQQMGGDRHEPPDMRRKGVRISDEDDEPTYVNDDSETLSKEEVRALLEPDAVDPPKSAKVLEGTIAAASGRTDIDSCTTGRPRPMTNSGGLAIKKRKIARVIGRDEDGKTEGSAQPALANQKKPKKHKPIALSFSDENEKE